MRSFILTLALFGLLLPAAYSQQSGTIEIPDSYGSPGHSVSYSVEIDGADLVVRLTSQQGGSGLQARWDGFDYGNNKEGVYEPGQSIRISNGTVSGVFLRGVIWGQTTSATIGPFYGAVPSYKVLITLPANGTNSLIRYECYQGETMVASYTTSPGDPVSLQTLTLQKPDPVAIREVQSVLLFRDDGSAYFGDNPVVAVVATVTPTSSGTVAVLPAATTAGATTGVAKTTPTAAPTAVTPTAAPTVATPTAVPTAATPTAVAVVTPVVVTNNGTTSDAVTTALDAANKTSAAGAAATVAAIDKTTAAVVDVGGKLIVSTDKTTAAVVDVGGKLIVATDKTTAAVVDGATKTIAAVDTVAGVVRAGANATISSLSVGNATLDAINKTLAATGTAAEKAAASEVGGLAAIASKIDATNQRLDDIRTAANKSGEVAQLVLDQRNYSAASVLADSRTAVPADGGYTGLKPGSGRPSVSGGGDYAVAGVVGVAGRDVKFSLRLQDYYSGADGILRAGRALILLAMGVAFMRSCSTTVETYVAALGNSGGGSGIVGTENVVPGVAHAKHLASAGGIVTAIAAATASIVALVDTTAGYAGISVTSLTQSLSLDALGGAYSFLDQFFPVAASATFAVMRAAFGYLVAPIYLAASALARFLHI